MAQTDDTVDAGADTPAEKLLRSIPFRDRADVEKLLLAAIQRERDRAAEIVLTKCHHGEEHAWAEDSELEELVCVICGMGESIVSGYADRIRRGEG